MATRRRAAPVPPSFSSTTSSPGPSSGGGPAVIYGYGDLPTTIVPVPPSAKERVKANESQMGEATKGKSKTGQSLKSKQSSKRHKDGGKPYRSTGRLQGMIILFLINLSVILVFQFLRQPQRNLSKLVSVHDFLQSAKPMLGVDYVVFVSASTTHAGGTYVRVGRSNVTAMDALQQATRKLPVSKHFSWFQVDYVDGMQRLTNFNYDKQLAERYGDWFGLGLNWDAEIAFIPDQVNAHCFIDKSHYLRWERLAMWMHRHNFKGIRGMVPDYSDDSTYLEQLDLFHTKSIFIDMTDTHHRSAAPAIALEHGHRHYFDSKLTAHDFRLAAIAAGKYLMQTSGKKDQGIVSYYLPRSHFIEYSHQSSELWHGHASALYALSKLHTTWRDSRLLHTITEGLDHLRTQHLKHCPLANGNHAVEGMCIRDEKDSSSLLTNNSMLLLAMIEFYETTSSSDAGLFDAMTKLANFVEGSFIDNDKLFLQNIVFDKSGSVMLDTETKEASAEAQAAFSLARLANFCHAKRLRFRKEWKEIAFRTVDKLVLAKLEEFPDSSHDFVPDHWLLQAIYQIYKFHRHSGAMVQYTARSAEFAIKYQVTKRPLDKSERLDLWGSFLHDSSATASAALSHALCTVYPMLENKNALFPSLELATKFQLQFQIKPETAMWMRDPQRILGGMREGHDSLDMSIADSTENILSFLCIASLLQ
ncbi:hypothetical protein MHU86_20965 [Fragilaria crotonensis]|nr:hypothetical protein MHU86_20965 [Fragilaria crotonensis]